MTRTTKQTSTNCDAMKIILKNNVVDYINALFTRFQISGRITDKQLDGLVDKFKKVQDNVSYEDTEKAISCIYLLQQFGIPLKSSAEVLSLDSAKAFKLFKYLNVPSYIYIDNLVEFLTRYEKEEYKKRFKQLFESMKAKSPDLFILAVALNISLKQEFDIKSFVVKDNMYGYSDTTLSKYRKLITDSAKITQRN